MMEARQEVCFFSFCILITRKFLVGFKSYMYEFATLGCDLFLDIEFTL